MGVFFRLLMRVFDHLLGVHRPNFRRLFMATCKGESCPELDRLKVTPAPCLNEVTDKQTGYWLPMYTWPIVRVLLTASHQQEVAAGKARPMSSVSLPENQDRVKELSDLLVMLMAAKKLNPDTEESDGSKSKGESDAHRPSTEDRRVHEEGVSGVARPADRAVP
jgi:hypothetical protein